MKKNNPPSLWQRFAGETVGTYLLVVFVIAAYFITLATGGSTVGYALSYAVSLGLIIAFLGEWSRQFNPIVSLTLFIIRQQSLLAMIVAVAGQLLGAVLAALTVRPLINLAQGQVEALVPALSPEALPLGLVTAVEGFGIIFLLLAYVWVSISENKENMKLLPVLAGLSVIPGAVVATVVSGAAFNPIRVLGAALIEGGAAWQYHWVYWVGPLLAALVVTIVVGIHQRMKTRS